MFLEGVFLLFSNLPMMCVLTVKMYSFSFFIISFYLPYKGVFEK